MAQEETVYIKRIERLSQYVTAETCRKCAEMESKGLSPRMTEYNTG